MRRGGGIPVSSVKKGLGKVEVGLKWDPSSIGAPPHDLDIVAAAYPTGAPYAEPAYVVHFGSRSPDGTITLSRDSRDGKGFGFDEVMVLEFDRIPEAYTRVVVGVVIQQTQLEGRKTFAAIRNTGVRIASGYTELATSDFAEVSGDTAATVAEFTREASGVWEFRRVVRGFDADPASFAAELGRFS
ncbi:TerD family protein [Streptomyces sp. NBC_01304]|uniref:TerD family protein n=1 Tax=Streptomyces sp. NBC_01304 TaxID=2903818 RepID=UPI002E0F019C|nr:TerD family protein [Streptomyces sp. NBC_01304]